MEIIRHDVRKILMQVAGNFFFTLGGIKAQKH